MRIDDLESRVISAVEDGIDEAKEKEMRPSWAKRLVVRRVRGVFGGARAELDGATLEGAPPLVGVKAAAEILGVRKTRIYALDGVPRHQGLGRLPKPWLIPDNGPLYIRSDIEALAEELEAERESRAQRRAEREAS